MQELPNLGTIVWQDPTESKANYSDTLQLSAKIQQFEMCLTKAR